MFFGLCMAPKSLSTALIGFQMSLILKDQRTWRWASWFVDSTLYISAYAHVESYRFLTVLTEFFICFDFHQSVKPIWRRTKEPMSIWDGLPRMQIPIFTERILTIPMVLKEISMRLLAQTTPGSKLFLQVFLRSKCLCVSSQVATR